MDTLIDESQKKFKTHGNPQTVKNLTERRIPTFVEKLSALLDRNEIATEETIESLAYELTRLNSEISILCPITNSAWNKQLGFNDLDEHADDSKPKALNPEVITVKESLIRQIDFLIQSKKASALLASNIASEKGRMAYERTQTQITQIKTIVNRAYGKPADNNWKDSILGVDNQYVFRTFSEISAKDDNAQKKISTKDPERFVKTTSENKDFCAITGNSFATNIPAISNASYDEDGKPVNAYQNDASYVARTPDNGWVIAVADGCGGHESLQQDEDIGRTAYFAAKEATRLMSVYPTADALKANIGQVKKEVAQGLPIKVRAHRGKSLKTSQHERTTLACVRAFPTPDGKFRIVGMNIGDGMVITYNPKTDEFKTIANAKDFIRQDGKTPAALPDLCSDNGCFLNVRKDLPPEAAMSRYLNSYILTTLSTNLYYVDLQGNIEEIKDGQALEATNVFYEQNVLSNLNSQEKKRFVIDEKAGVATAFLSNTEIQAMITAHCAHTPHRADEMDVIDEPLLDEDTLVLCLCDGVWQGLPTTRNSEAEQARTNAIVTTINFDELRNDPAFKLPNDITPNSMTQALVNCAVSRTDRQRRERLGQATVSQQVLGQLIDINTIAIDEVNKMVLQSDGIEKERIEKKINVLAPDPDNKILNGARQHLRNTELKVGDDITIVCAQLTHKKVDQQNYLTWINPTNFSIFAAAAIGLFFGLKGLASVEVFAAAAPILLGLVTAFGLLAGLATIVFFAHAIKQDFQHQEQNGNLHRGLQDRFHGSILIYLIGFFYRGRIGSWISGHPVQTATIIFTTLLMFALTGLAINYIIDPNLINFLKPVFDFIATAIPSGLSEFGKAIGLDLSIEVGSIISDAILVIVAALTPVVIFDFGRRIAAALSPTEPKDERAKDYDLDERAKDYDLPHRIIGDGLEPTVPPQPLRTNPVFQSAKKPKDSDVQNLGVVNSYINVENDSESFSELN